MCAFVLLHVVFTGEGFVASRAVDVFLAGVFFPVAGGMAGGRECVLAIETVGVGARVFFLVRSGGFGVGG